MDKKYWLIVGWYEQWHGSYGIFPTVELAKRVALELTPINSRYAAYPEGILWRYDHIPINDDPGSGIIRTPFLFEGSIIIQWSIQSVRLEELADFLDEGINNDGPRKDN